MTALKTLTLAINVAVLAYLLFAHRLFGLRGGAEAEVELHRRDTGWGALARVPVPGLHPAAT